MTKGYRGGVNKHHAAPPPHRPRRGLVYHVLNRRVGRLGLFETERDYAAFERILEEAVARTGIRLVAYCLPLFRDHRAHSLFVRRRKMSKSSSSKTSRTDWSRIKAMKDKDIKLTSEHPEADVKHIVRGILRQGLKPVPSKASISLRVDADVLEWFKVQGPGYQTRINAVLRAFKSASFDLALPSGARGKRRRAA